MLRCPVWAMELYTAPLKCKQMMLICEVYASTSKEVQAAQNSSPGQTHPSHSCITANQLAEAVKCTFRCKINDGSSNSYV
jgi:hypothetical protein